MAEKNMQIISPDGDYSTILHPETNVGQVIGLNNVLASKADKTYVDGEINNLKQSVSSGKSLVATSITGKGVPTVATDTFQKMAQNIDSIKLGSGNATSDKVLAPFTFTNSTGIETTGTMPNNGDVSSAIVNAVLKSGYTSGGTIANLINTNIADGVNIAGIVGTYKGGGDIIYGRTSRTSSTRPLYSLSNSMSTNRRVATITGISFIPKYAFLFKNDNGGTDQASRCNITFYIHKDVASLASANTKFSISGTINGFYSKTEIMTSYFQGYGRCRDDNSSFGYYNGTLYLPVEETTFYSDNYWEYVVIG